MKRIVIFRAAILAFAVVLPAAAQNAGAPPPLTQKLGVMPEVTIGTLPNGLPTTSARTQNPRSAWNCVSR